MIIEDNGNINKEEAVKLAQSLVNRNALILDTETTGLGEKDEIVEITVIDMKGQVYIDTLIKPTILIPPNASAIHKIKNMDIINSPSIIDIYGDLAYIFKNNIVAIYNAEFDIRLICQSLNAHGKKFPHNNNNVCCVMKLYSQYSGIYDAYKRGYQWFKLSAAASRLGITIPYNLHRARIDTDITRQIILKIAGN
ncbi:MAG: 3'-5' exonuclease [Eubacteriaceae bacterium]